MTSQTGKQAIPIQILPNISRSKKNHTQNLVENLFSDSFLKHQN